MSEDCELLRRYRDAGDEAAFGELVGRYLNLVWATCNRITGDGELARDLAQRVFSDLACKAGRCSAQVELAGWLHRAATLVACRAVRDRQRRARREKEAMDLQRLSSSPEEKDCFESWFPILDEALGKLGSADREAILLRFFQGKSLADVGVVFGVSEDAAQKRLSRALERLRVQFHHRGVAVSSAALMAGLGVAGTQAAPASLAVSVASGSLATAAASGLSPLLGRLPSVIQIMKTKLALTVLTVATVSTPLVLQQGSLAAARAQRASLQTQLSRLPKLEEEHRRLQAHKGLADEMRQLEGEQAEIVTLQARLEQLRGAGVQARLDWQPRLDAARNALQVAQRQTARIQAQVNAKELSEKRIEDMKNLGLAARVYAVDNQDRFPTQFVQMTNELGRGFDVSAYEFMPQPRPVSETEPGLILFREREPRQLPDGAWERCYTLADGSVQRIKSRDGSFAEFEKAHTIQPDADLPPAGH